MLSRTASLLSKRAGHSISSAVSKQLAPAVMASSAGSVSAAANPSLSSGRQYTTHSQLPEEHQMIYEMCRNFANEELAPNAGEWDQKHAFPTEAITHMVRNDIQRSARGWPQSFFYLCDYFVHFEGRTCQDTRILPLFAELGLLCHAPFLAPSYSFDFFPITEMSIN